MTSTRPTAQELIDRVRQLVTTPPESPLTDGMYKPQYSARELIDRATTSMYHAQTANDLFAKFAAVYATLAVAQAILEGNEKK